MIESFNNSDSLNAYTALHTLNGNTATLAAAAAHDGPLGLSTGLTMPWSYRLDAGAQVEQGETISLWVEPVSLSGDLEFGFVRRQQRDHGAG